MSGWRRRLGGVHDWAGVLLGGLLFVVFWMGSLSVFDRELDRWMMPATRLAAPAGPPPLDAAAAMAATLVPPGARQWRLDWATARTPVLRLSWQARDGRRSQVWLDPARMTVIDLPDSLGASGFFFPLHYGLHLGWKDLGKWLVGLAAMAMLVLLVSGVVIHRKLWSDFFRFRPGKRLPRSSLDLHNLAGVTGLPFHLAITLSGLVIFWSLYFPQAHHGVYGTSPQARADLQADAYGRFTRVPAAAPGAATASLDAMADQARQLWGGRAEPYFLRVWNPGQDRSHVEFRRSYAREVTMNLDQLFFDAYTGQLLQRFEAAPAMGVQRFVSGLHFVQYEHALLRWLYFGLGLSGCVMIATGLVHWLAARRARGATDRSWRLVQALSVACIGGCVAASLAYLGANRLLPAQAQAGGLGRAGLEVAVFCMAWLACGVHALARGTRAWREQALAIASLALACVALNAATTAAYRSSATPLAVWGVDAMLLVLAATAWRAGQRLPGAD
ncbi:MAG: PepSY domain-containing protein [Delftia acidovorans]|jgi:uncharacterized iron-regulated membrane protein|nr:PepSY domain-containing protein [Delftia acidovorans]